MPKELDFEAILYLPRLAYKRKTEQDWDYFSEVSYETGSNRNGWGKELVFE